MKKTTKIVFIIITIMSLGWACRKIEVGFLSDNIRYSNPLIKVERGANYVSPALVSDGSTLPLKVELLAIRNKLTGEIATDLLTSHDVVTWTTPYDYKLDTIEANLRKKLTIVQEPALEINQISGQVRFGTSTSYAEGTKYEFDLRISNVNGTKDFPGIGQIVMPTADSILPIKWFGKTRLRAVDKTTNTIVWTLFEDLDKLEKGTSIWQTITHTKDVDLSGSKGGITVILQAFDKNGVAFSPAKGELKSSWPGTLLPGYEMCSINTERKEDRIVYNFPVLPFPYYSWYVQGPTLIYYQIDSKAVGIVGTPEIPLNKDDKGVPFVYDPTHNYWLNWRNDIKISQAGTWEIKVHFMNTVHR